MNKLKSTMVEGSPEEEMSEPKSEEMKEPLSEHELDMHHDTLMKAEAIKGNPHIMKQLKPHMVKKMGHMKKITSLEDLKMVAKKKMMEP
jgi:hypothetical protein